MKSSTLQAAIALPLLVVGCASIPPESRYPEIQADAPAALIVNQGSVGGSTTTCQLPGGNRVCRASLVAIDNKVVPNRMGSENRVEPGLRKVTVFCTYHDGSTKGVGKAYEISLEANRKYYVRATMQGPQCNPWLAASQDGEPLGTAVPFQPAQVAPSK